MPLFGNEPAPMGQVVGLTALISTIVTGILALVGTYLSNRQAARLKADDRDNDDKWKMIGELQKEVARVKKEYAEHRDEAQQRYDDLASEHRSCLQNFARVEERVGFLEDHLEALGHHVPRKRPSAGSAAHTPLPPAAGDTP
jgi:Zn-dependent M32 family carboxypeptidase